MHLIKQLKKLVVTRIYYSLNITGKGVIGSWYAHDRKRGVGDVKNRPVSDSLN